MLSRLGYASLEDLIEAAVPPNVRDTTEVELPPAVGEAEVLAELRRLAALNSPGEPMIGLGYYGTVTPPVIRRNVLEDPAWYTAYTPYQPEISQGRLEALLNFQTMVADLTGLPTANASLLDEATAAAEAVTVMRRSAPSRASRVVLDADCLPQTIAVVQTRCEAVGVETMVCDLTSGLPDTDFFGVVLQFPGASGAVRDFRALTERVRDVGALTTVAADLLALTVLTPPGEWGADLVVGSTQRFGVPLGYGGPHAGYIAVRAGLERSLPGRLVGVSVDAAGGLAYRLALQTREQHIRREKATSNICTAQVLLAVVASMYAVYHGPEGLTDIALAVHERAKVLADTLRRRRGRGRARLLLRHDPGALAGPGRGGGRGRGRARCPHPSRRCRPRGSGLLRDDGGRSPECRSEGVRSRTAGRSGRAVRVADRNGAPCPGPAQPVPLPPSVQPPPVRDGDAAIPPETLGPGLRARPRHDPARLVHHEAERRGRDGTDQFRRLRQPASFRSAGGSPRVYAAHLRAGAVAGRPDRLCRGFGAAQRRQPGRAGRAAGHPRLPSLSERRSP